MRNPIAAPYSQMVDVGDASPLFSGPRELMEFLKSPVANLPVLARRPQLLSSCALQPSQRLFVAKCPIARTAHTTDATRHELHDTRSGRIKDQIKVATCQFKLLIRKGMDI